MIKFKYYITDTMSGTVFGSNNDSSALELSKSEEFFVVDVTTGTWLLSDGKRQEIVDESSRG